MTNQLKNSSVDWEEFSKPTQFRFGKGFPSFLQRQGCEAPRAVKADPSVSVDYLQGIVIETKDGAMAGVYYWRCKTTGDQRRAWELNRCNNQMKDGSCQTWGESLATHRQTPLHHFSFRKALLLVTEHALSRILMQSRQKKQCFLPIKWIDFLLLSVPSPIPSLSNGSVQFYRSYERVHSRLTLISVYVLCELIFACRSVSLKDTDLTGSLFKLSKLIMSIKAILCGDFPLCALLS